MDELMSTDQGAKELIKIQKESDSSNGYDDGTQKSFAGCTATVVLITPTEVYCANAGDSRTVLSKNKQAVDLSKDHKPDDPEERTRIYAANGFVEDGRVNGMLALSRALGDFEYKNNSLFKVKDQVVSAFPDVKVVPITNDAEFILLACDGIWDVMTSQAAITYCHQTIYNSNYGRQKRTL